MSSPAPLSHEPSLLAPDGDEVSASQTTSRTDGRVAELGRLLRYLFRMHGPEALGDLAADQTVKINYIRFEPPPARKAGVKVADVTELVETAMNGVVVVRVRADLHAQVAADAQGHLVEAHLDRLGRDDVETW